MLKLQSFATIKLNFSTYDCFDICIIMKVWILFKYDFLEYLGFNKKIITVFI